MNRRTTKLLRRYALERSATEQEPGKATPFYAALKRQWVRIPWRERITQRRLMLAYLKLGAAKRRAVTGGAQ